MPKSVGVKRRVARKRYCPNDSLATETLASR